MDRNELHELIDDLPDNQVASAADELRRRMPDSAATSWPPEFFAVIDGTEVPADVARNVDLHLAAFGFGRDSL